MEREALIQKRVKELAQMAYDRGIVTFTDFLDMNEQNIVKSISWKNTGVVPHFSGGYEMSERQMVAFIPDALSYDWDYPFRVLKIVPEAPKFAEKLGHRDYLGAVLNLGIDRSKIGDLIVKEQQSYLFCEEKIAHFLLKELTRVRHTLVHTELVDDYEEETRPNLVPVQGTVASVRLDAVIALAFHTSRNSVLPEIEGGKVFVNARLTVSNGHPLKEGDVISVRGRGKFRFGEILSQTKKGRNLIVVYRYE